MRLIVESLGLDRGGRHIVSALSFNLDQGEAMVLTGPNGAGKTTLLRALAGFLPPIEGSIRLEGAPADVEIAEQCHFIGHRDGVKGALSVLENLRFTSRYLGNGTGVDAALDRLGLTDLAHVPAAYLSAGQRRRVGLARLMLAKRPLWLLDEPTVSLDASSVVALAEIVQEHVAGGGMAVVATHIPLGLTGAKELTLGGRPASLTTGGATG
jgi:heme exporter protein A